MTKYNYILIKTNSKIFKIRVPDKMSEYVSNLNICKVSEINMSWNNITKDDKDLIKLYEQQDKYDLCTYEFISSCGDFIYREEATVKLLKIYKRSLREEKHYNIVFLKIEMKEDGNCHDIYLL